jgi:iron complex transport system ATP-binding protein
VHYPVLELRDVTFVRSGRALLSPTDLSIQSGERWALIGANGAGKSTLLNLAGAITHPTSGVVEILGQRLGRVDIRALREQIGHVNPRHPVDSALTLEQVVLTGMTGTTALMMRWEADPDAVDRARELVDRLGIAHRRDAHWATLSQGERGRALIARALLPRPHLLLLDEPATGLDVAAREQLLSTVDAVHASEPELASVLVTHHFEELPVSTTHAALIRDGVLEHAGLVDDVLTTENVSRCFDHPITVTREDGRWRARA